MAAIATGSQEMGTPSETMSTPHCRASSWQARIATRDRSCVDDDFGPFFLKFCSYFPYNAKLCINGNEWAKRQADKAGIGFAA